MDKIITCPGTCRTYTQWCELLHCLANHVALSDNRAPLEVLVAFIVWDAVGCVVEYITVCGNRFP